jgi:hypothetical protein
MLHRIAVPLLSLTVLGACDGPRNNPVSHDASVTAVALSSAPTFVRSGALNVQKECSGYTGQAGEICTITSSNVPEIEVGSTITYASAVAGGALDSDVTLDLPGPGNNKAFGHCTLSLATGIGECTLSGGTGKFQWLRARVAVSPLGWPNFAWDGTYSYGK